MNFPVFEYKSDNFAQGQQNFARTHVCVSVTFRNTAWWNRQIYITRTEIVWSRAAANSSWVLPVEGFKDSGER